jgi:hypothetical protein
VRSVAALSGAGVSVLLAVCVFGVGARDDDYITYWVAEQLAKTGHFVNIDGARIEQSSSLAHVLVLAALYFVTRLPLPVLGFAVGLASLVATIWLTSRLAGRARPEAWWAATLVVAIAYPIVYWATGGLETVFAAASVLWFLHSLHGVLTRDDVRARTIVAYAASCLLVVAVRPDTMVVSIVLVLGVVGVGALRALRPLANLLPEVATRRAVLAAMGPVGATAVVTAFRLVEFHRFLPEPELAKKGGLSTLPAGFSYVFSSFPHWMWAAYLVLLVLGVACVLATRSLLGLLMAATFILGVVGIMFTRGDWMGGARLLVPYLAPGLIVMVLGVWWLARWWRVAVLAALAVVECVALVYFADGATWVSSAYTAQSENPAFVISGDIGSPFGATVTSSAGPVPSEPWYTAWDFPHERDAVFLAAATPKLRAILERAHGPGRITIASYQAGMVAYTWQNEFPGRLDFIDMDGLVNNVFSRCQGLAATFAGEIITLPQWARDAGRCAPPLPDLLFLVIPPWSVPGLEREYHVVEIVTVNYRRHALFATPRLFNVEFLAARIGWQP